MCIYIYNEALRSYLYNKTRHSSHIYKCRFLLTVHTISQSHLKKLDTFTDKFVKKWTGLPPCATNSALHLKPGLDITSISTQYKTTITQAYTRIRILGDETVNSALQSKLDRVKKLAT